MEGFLFFRPYRHPWLYNEWSAPVWAEIRRHELHYSSIPPPDAPRPTKIKKLKFTGGPNNLPAVDLRNIVEIVDEDPNGNEFVVAVSFTRPYRFAGQMPELPKAILPPYDPVKKIAYRTLGTHLRQQLQLQSEQRRDDGKEDSLSEYIDQAERNEAVDEGLEEPEVFREGRDVNTARVYPNVTGHSRVFYLEFQAMSLTEKRGWLDSLSVFDKVHYDPEDRPHIAEDQVLLALGMPRNGTNSEEEIAEAAKSYLMALFIDTPSVMNDAIFSCMNFLEDEGVNTLGIFRLAGSMKEQKPLLQQLMTDAGAPVPSDAEVMVVADLLKVLLRRMPESVLTNYLYPFWLEAAVANDIPRLKALASLLPKINRDMIIRLIGLIDVVINTPNTQMDLSAVTTVVGPNIMPALSPEALKSFKGDARTQALFRVLLESLPEIFPEEAASALAINVADTEAEQKEKAELQAARLIPYGVDPNAPVEDSDRKRTEETATAAPVGDRVLTVSAKTMKIIEKMAAEKRARPSTRAARESCAMKFSLEVPKASSAQVVEAKSFVRQPREFASPAFVSPTLAGPSFMGLSIAHSIGVPQQPEIVPVSRAQYPPEVLNTRHLPFAFPVAPKDAIAEPMAVAKPAPAPAMTAKGDEPDIDAGMEAGGNGDSNRKQASKAKVKSHMDGLTDPEANKDPEVKKALVYKRPLQPFTTRFPQEVRSGALVSPILSIPALIAVKIGASLGVVSSNYRTSSSLIPSPHETGLSSISACYSTRGTAPPLIEKTQVASYDGPDLSLPKAHLLYHAIEAVRSKMDAQEDKQEALMEIVAKERYAAEWEDYILNPNRPEPTVSTGPKVEIGIQVDPMLFDKAEAGRLLGGSGPQGYHSGADSMRSGVTMSDADEFRLQPSTRRQGLLLGGAGSNTATRSKAGSVELGEMAPDDLPASRASSAVGRTVGRATSVGRGVTSGTSTQDDDASSRPHGGSIELGDMHKDDIGAVRSGLEMDDDDHLALVMEEVAAARTSSSSTVPAKKTASSVSKSGAQRTKSKTQAEDIPLQVLGDAQAADAEHDDGQAPEDEDWLMQEVQAIQRLSDQQGNNGLQEPAPVPRTGTNIEMQRTTTRSVNTAEIEPAKPTKSISSTTGSRAPRTLTSSSAAPAPRTVTSMSATPAPRTVTSTSGTAAPRTMTSTSGTAAPRTLSQHTRQSVAVGHPMDAADPSAVASNSAAGVALAKASKNTKSKSPKRSKSKDKLKKKKKKRSKSSEKDGGNKLKASDSAVQIEVEQRKEHMGEFLETLEKLTYKVRRARARRLEKIRKKELDKVLQSITHSASGTLPIDPEPASGAADLMSSSRRGSATSETSEAADMAAAIDEIKRMQSGDGGPTRQMSVLLDATSPVADVPGAAREANRILKDASMLEKYIAERRLEMERRKKEQEDAEKRAQQKAEREARRLARQHRRRLRARRRQEKSRRKDPIVLEQRPHRLAFERDAAILAVVRQELRELRLQYNKLLLDLEAIAKPPTRLPLYSSL